MGANEYLIMVFSSICCNAFSEEEKIWNKEFQILEKCNKKTVQLEFFVSNLKTKAFVGARVHEFFKAPCSKWFNKILNTALFSFKHWQNHHHHHHHHNHHHGQYVLCVFMDSGENSPGDSSALPWTPTPYYQQWNIPILYQ